jgi:antigen flippase
MSSYRQIFKSTAIVGGAQVIVLLVGLVRQKAMALWLGTSGVGIASLYMSGISLVGVISSLGIGASGVRQIAESAGTGDQKKLGRTVRTLRLVAIVTSVIGMLAVIFFCRPIMTAFGKEKYAAGFALVSVALLFTGISTGQVALLQGLRRLKEMALAQVTGAILGSIVGVAIIFWLRERGVVWFLISVAASASLASWWFARRVEVPKAVMGWKDYSAEAKGLLAMGIAFMCADRT